MKIAKTIGLVGGEILARDIVNESGVVLIPAGTVLKKEYINKLIELNEDVIYIKKNHKDVLSDEEVQIIEMECSERIKDTMERYFSSSSDELIKLNDIAKDIITGVLNNPQLLFNVNSIRNNDRDKYSHSVNVCTMSVMFALRMGLNSKEIREIAIGSLLHDIGYEYVNAKLANNMSRYLEIDAEKEKKKHVIHGYNILENEEWISQNSKDIILYHHERIDGTGYPMHLKGDQINKGVKIVAVCDEFDNLVFLNKKKVHHAIEYIVSEAGNKFDFEVVSIFNEMVAAYPIDSLVLTNSKEIGIVIRQNNKCPTRPVIRILKDNNGVLKDNIERDLTKELTLFITDTLDDEQIKHELIS